MYLNLISDILLWTPAYGNTSFGRPAQERWKIGTDDERESNGSMQSVFFAAAAAYDDDVDDK